MQSEQQQRIMGYFIEEAKDHLNTIEQGLLNLQSTIEDSEMVNEVFRAAHSVKGGAAMLGINSIQQVSHRLEDCFKLLKECPIKVDQKLESLFLRVFDTLHELLEQLQGPFGLTEDTANGIMSGIEPIFTELTNHLEGLITQAGGVIPVEEGSSFIPVVVEATPIPVSAAPLHQEESALLLLFQSDVPTRLREMLQLFKQSENSENRQQLQDLCRGLGQLGEPFDLPSWCDLLEVTRQAIACPDNAYRTLAPIVIKEIKKAQELVLSNQAAAIVASDALSVLVPISSAAAETEPTFDDLLAADIFEFANEPEESLTGAFDLFEAAEDPSEVDIFAVDLAEDSQSADSQSAGLDDWFSGAPLELDATTSDAALGLDLSANLSGDAATPEQSTGDRNGPEVGMAELNSLADLFEGEVLDLGVTWQEEEIIREAAESIESSANNAVNSDDFDFSDDFSDLLFEEPDGSGSSAKAKAADDLASLFGSDDLLNDESLDLPEFEEIADTSLDAAAIAPEAQPDEDFLGELADGFELDVLVVESSVDSSTLEFSEFETSEFETSVANAPAEELESFTDLFVDVDETELFVLETSTEEATTVNSGDLSSDELDSDALGSDDFTDFLSESTAQISFEALESEPDLFASEPMLEADAELELALDSPESIGLFGEEVAPELVADNLAVDETDLDNLFETPEDSAFLADTTSTAISDPTAIDDEDDLSNDLWSEGNTDSSEPVVSWLDTPLDETEEEPFDLSLDLGELSAETETADFLGDFSEEVAATEAAETDLNDLFAPSEDQELILDTSATNSLAVDPTPEQPPAAIADPWEEQGLADSTSDSEPAWNLDPLDEDLLATPEAISDGGENPFDAVGEELESLDFDLEVSQDLDDAFIFAAEADEELLLEEPIEEPTGEAEVSDWTLADLGDSSDELSLDLLEDSSAEDSSTDAMSDLWDTDAFEQQSLDAAVAETDLSSEFDSALLPEEPGEELSDADEFADFLLETELVETELVETELSDRVDDLSVDDSAGDLGFELSRDETTDLWGDDSAATDESALDDLSLGTSVAATESTDNLIFEETIEESVAEPVTEALDLADMFAESAELSELMAGAEEFDFDLASDEASDLEVEASTSEADLTSLSAEDTGDWGGSADDPLANFSIEADFADATADPDQVSSDTDDFDFDFMTSDGADDREVGESTTELDGLFDATASDTDLFDQELSLEVAEPNSDLGDLADFMGEPLEARDASSDLSELEGLSLSDLSIDQPETPEDLSFELAANTSDELDFGADLTSSADLGDLLDDSPSEPDAIAFDLDNFDDLSLDQPSAESPETSEDFIFEPAETSNELDFGAELDFDLDATSSNTEADALADITATESLDTADFAFDLDSSDASFNEDELEFDSLLASDLDLSESLTPVEPSIETESELDFGTELAAEPSIEAENELDFGDELALEGLFDAEPSLDNLSEADLFGLSDEPSEALDNLSEAAIDEDTNNENWLGDFDAGVADIATSTDADSATSDELGDFFATESSDSTADEPVDLFADSLNTEAVAEDDFGFDTLDFSDLSSNETDELSDASAELDALSALVEDDLTTPTESTLEQPTESSFDFDEVDLDLFDVAPDTAAASVADTGDFDFSLESSEAVDENDFDLFALDSADDFSSSLDLSQQTNSDVTDTSDTDLDDFLAAAMEDSSQDSFDFATESAGSLDNFDDLEALLNEDDSATSSSASVASEDADFSGLEALLDEEPSGWNTGSGGAAAFDGVAGNADSASGLDGEFDDLEKLLEDADNTLGGPPTVKTSRGAAPQSSRRPGRRGAAGFAEQTMRVPVKHLDNLSNLVGELVVNRNSLEQDQERLRQFLDNLLYQVQQLSDVGQRMRDLYERSLLESSLLASRQSHQSPLHNTNANGGAQNSHSTGASFDALEMDRFTGFHTLSQEMIELIVRVRESASDIEFIVDETDQVTRMFRQVTTQLQEGLTRSRMVPFAQIADRLPRAVRDIALKCGKQAELHVEGRETLIDKMILEQLYDPMTHLVNNAIAHGIETPEVRQAAGKPPTGRITIRAFHQGNQTVISVSDDGAGIEPERVKTKAIEKRLITSAEARTLSRLDIYDLLFHPGFTTQDQVTDYAGRGVGMDVVRTSLGEIRGAITTDSAVAKGTTFTIRLPLTLSISKALCCISNRARIAFPMDGVEDMLDVPKERIQANPDGQPCILWRDLLLPFRPLSEILKYNRYLGRGSVYGGNQEDDIVSIVVLRSAGNFIALQVDQVLGEQEIVIKQLEGPVPKPIGVAGATVLGDGRIMPIADVLELIDLSMGRIRREASTTLWDQSAEPPVAEPVAKTDPTVLIVDDSITVRELLSMTFNKIGYRVEQARDGQEAWEKLRSGLPCDMVFCDIEMPRMDGLELLSRIQKDSTLNHIPIAMLTSRGADRHRQMAVQLGAKGYFTKPYLEEALLDAAQRMLKGEVLIAGSGSHA
ncbi:MAG: response regulator [Trichocoleus desertorum ATA4-8-CV12]|jgi:chemosensory pili system protein ChpA (sensor histidine kinase/response regulator)|nr:response regulator [Trichocoleus desertorum ATA4-8-CV12]